MNDVLLFVPVALPLLGSIIALALPRRAEHIGLLATAGGVVATLAIGWQVLHGGQLQLALGGWQPGLGIALHADALSTLLLIMSALVMLAASLYATSYFGEPQIKTHFWPLWLLMGAAVQALLLSGDVFNLYVTLELLGLSAVALASLGGKRAAVEAALRYLTVGLLGSMSYLAGVALLYAAYGTLDIPTLATRLDQQPAAWVALSLMTAGVLVKAALFPLHFWLPAAHANAPAPVSAALSALVVKVAVYLIVRLWLDLFAPVLTPAHAGVLGVLGAIAVVWGSWLALRATRLKLMAAYSTIAQLGYLFVSLPLLLATPAGLQRDIVFGALVVLALTHGFAKSAFFLAAGIIQQRAGHDRITDLGGTARALPVTTFVLALAGVALIGLPPSGTFLAKWQLLAAAVSSGQWFWIPVVAVGSLLAAAYVFRVLGHAFGPGERLGPTLRWGRQEVPALLLALVSTLGLGLAGNGVWTFLGHTGPMAWGAA